MKILMFILIIALTFYIIALRIGGKALGLMLKDNEIEITDEKIKEYIEKAIKRKTDFHK